MENNINVIVVSLFLMGVLSVVLVSAAIMSARQGASKMGELLCVGGKWLKVGVFRFWQRKKCAKRRQDGQTVDPSQIKKAVTVDFDLILPSLEAGPVRGRPEYSPHYGYEPYWPEGDWVFDKDPNEKNGTLFMCGVRCPRVYTEYGKVCGRNKDYEYETFVNYCELRSKDCSNVERWMVMYRGECFRNITTFTMIGARNRTVKFIETFMSRYITEKYVGFCDPCPAAYT